MSSSRKHPYFPYRRNWTGGYARAKNLNKCMKLNWNFQRGGEVLEKNSFHGEGTDIFWNYMYKYTIIIYLYICISHSP